MKKFLAIALALVLCLVVFVACDNTQSGVTSDLDSAKQYINALYKNDSEVTASDYNVVTSTKVGETTYTVEWSVEVTAGAADGVKVVVNDDNTATIDVNEDTIEEIVYTLNGKISGPDGKSVTVSYNRKVPAFAITSWDSYMAAVEGDTVIVQGTVVAINSKAAGNSRNHLFIMDQSTTGGYYSYQMEADPVADLGIELGMTVRVTGPVTPYNGMQEIKGGTAEIIDSEKKEITPVDITDKFVEGTDFNKFVALPVVIKGVTIGAQDLATATSQYLYFELNGIKAYVRTYVTDFPTTLKAEDKATIDADHLAHFGYKADVAGILITYSGTPYIIPTTATPFTNYVEVEKTPAEKLAAELEALKLSDNASADAIIDLIATGKYYSDVTITWATTDTTGAATIADGKLTLKVPDKAVEVKVTATLKCGDATETKEFTIKLSKSATHIKDIVDLGVAQGHNTYTTGKYLAAGVIVEIQNDKYGNIVIKDENGNSILIYGTYIDGQKYGDFTGAKPVVGDYITVLGVVGQYNGTAQLKNADLVSFTAASSIKDAATTGAAQADNVYTETPYLVSGTITEIANDKYGNLYIKDAEGNTIYIYGLYDQAGTRYDALTTKPAVGDTITVLGSVGQYKGTAQFKNATLVLFTQNAGSGDASDETTAGSGETTTAPSTPATPAGALVIATYADANSWANGTAYLTINYSADVTITAAGTAVGDYSLNTGKYYENGENWRIYQTEKATVTIKAAEGKTIASVKITYASQNDGTLTQNGANVASDAVVTVNANSVSFGVGNTSDKTNGQARITAIEVTLA
jgi:predicted small secreted protein